MAATALYGLQGLTSDNSVVRRLIKLITFDLKNSKEHLDSQNIGNALYGIC